MSNIDKKIVIILAILIGLESTLSAYDKGLINRYEYEKGYEQAQALRVNHWTVIPTAEGYKPLHRVPSWVRRVR